MTGCLVSSATSATAGDAANDDIEECCNTMDDGSENAGNAINNSHDATSNSLCRKFISRKIHKLQVKS